MFQMRCQMLQAGITMINVGYAAVFRIYLLPESLYAVLTFIFQAISIKLYFNTAFI